MPYAKELRFPTENFGNDSRVQISFKKLTPIRPKQEEKVAIETIKAGDYVLSFDEVKKEKSYKKVTDTFVRTTELIYTVSFVNGVVEKIFTEVYIANEVWIGEKRRRKDKVILEYS